MHACNVTDRFSKAQKHSLTVPLQTMDALLFALERYGRQRDALLEQRPPRRNKRSSVSVNSTDFDNVRIFEMSVTMHPKEIDSTLSTTTTQAPKDLNETHNDDTKNSQNKYGSGVHFLEFPEMITKQHDEWLRVLNG